MVEILYKSKNAVVINKPQGMPAAPDPSGERNALNATSEMLRLMGEDGELWLVHRLDRVTGGVMIFARNKHVGAVLSEKIKGHQLVKEYIAVVEGRAESCEMEDYLYKDSIASRARITDCSKKGAVPALLTSRVVETVKTEKGEFSLVYITLKTGRFHQIRAQFSHRGLPIVGDVKYGSKNKGIRLPALCSAHLSLVVENEKIDCKAMPDVNTFPWSLFDLSKL